MDRTEARVTPGSRIMPSSGDVTKSSVCRTASKARTCAGVHDGWTSDHSLSSGPSDSRDVHGACLSDCLARQPQQLLIPERSSSALRDEHGRVDQTELEPAWPRAHMIADR